MTNANSAVFDALKFDVEVDVAGMAEALAEDARPERATIETMLDVLCYWLVLDDQQQGLT